MASVGQVCTCSGGEEEVRCGGATQRVRLIGRTQINAEQLWITRPAIAHIKCDDHFLVRLIKGQHLHAACCAT